MSTIQPTTSTTTGAASTRAAGAGAELGKSDFLKLLVTQLQHQDPMAPTEDREFMAQMAQFSALEQMTNVSVSLDRLTRTSQLDQGASLIGRTVGYQQGDQPAGSGVVSAVGVQDGDVVLHVGGTLVPLEAVLSVAPTPPPAQTGSGS
jgi:flagellar basal-body rod modification protein FlgD